MQSIRQINIPQPCSQQWQSMTEASNGRYCYHCSKTVIDFTAMNDQQIIDHLSSAGNVCGRVDALQLASINRQLVEHKHLFFNWKGFSLAASLFLALPVAGSYAQHKVKVVAQSAVHKAPLAKKVTYKTISGLVRDSVDKSPLPGAVITVKGTAVNTVSDMDGKYSIKVPSYADTLAVSFTGYTPQNICIPLDKQFIDIALLDCNRVKIVGYGSVLRQEILGGLIAIFPAKKVPFYKRWYQKFIKKPVKKIFG